MDELSNRSIDDQITDAVLRWASNHPQKFEPFIVFLEGERPLSPVEMAHAMANRTWEGQMQLKIFHSFIEDSGPEGMRILLGMFNDASLSKKRSKATLE